MKYDPQEAGALCHRCVLRQDGPPVPPEEHDGALFLAVAERPGDAEKEEKRPQVGPASRELFTALRAVGLSRRDVSYSNVLLCSRDGKNGLEKAYRQTAVERKAVEKENRDRKLRGLAALELPLDPHDACWPRLKRELDAYANVVPMGTLAAKTILQTATGINDLRGTMHARGTIDGRTGEVVPHDSGAVEQKILPMFNPAHVAHQKRWRSVFTADIARAYRWFTGTMRWIEPELVVYPDAAQLREWLFRLPAPPFTIYDVETIAAEKDIAGNSLFDPLTDELGLVGFCRPERRQAVVVPLRTIKGTSSRYTPDEMRDVLQVIAEWMIDPRFVKAGWNSDYYDLMVIQENYRRWIGIPITPAPRIDGILLHHVVASEHFHSLAFAASVYTDAPAWKLDDNATNAQTDEDWHKYNGRDVVITADVFPPLLKEAQRIGAFTPRHDGLPSLLAVEHGMAEVCCGMHRVGMYVDQDARLALEVELSASAQKWRDALFGRMVEAGIDVENFNDGRRAPEDLKRRKNDDDDDWEDRLLRVTDARRFNPSSREQVADLLFTKLDLDLAENVQPKDLWTTGGERSTNDAVLRSYVSDPTLPETVKMLVHALRLLRRATKTHSTFVYPLRSAWREPRCYLQRDGRVHPDYRAFGTIPGRLAASAPNVLNQPNEVRGMFAAPPGYALVGCDQDSLHLRIIGSRWKIPSLQEAYLGAPRFHREQRMGPHELFAELVYGNLFMASAHGTWPSENSEGKWKGVAKNCRDSCKTTRYAGCYGAKIGTIYREVTSTEDKKTGALPFKDKTMSDIEDIYDVWMTREPEWKRAWETEKELWATQHYADEPILGRRRYCGDEKETDIVNYPILAIEAALMNQITIDVTKAIPFEYIGPGVNKGPPRHVSGLIQQNYDSVLVECPIAQAPRVAAIVEELMTRSLPGMSIPFKGEAKIAPRVEGDKLVAGHWGNV